MLVTLQGIVTNDSYTSRRPGIGKYTDERTKELRRMKSSGMLRRVALVRTDVSEELITSIIRVTRIGELVAAKFLVHRFFSP
jgi:hypothetical protein